MLLGGVVTEDPQAEAGEKERDDDPSFAPTVGDRGVFLYHRS